MPVGARVPSGAWSAAVCSGSHGDHEPPRRRARTCASRWPPRFQRRPMRSKRRGACSTFVVRQPPATWAPPSSSASSNSEVPAAKAERGRSAVPATAAAPRPSASLRLRRRRCTINQNTGVPGKDHFVLGRTRSCTPGRTSGGPRRAVGTGAAKHDVMGFDGIAEALGEPVDELLELGVLEGVEAPAAVADRVVVVLAARVGGLEAGGAVDVDAADEPEPGEHVDRAVDAREPDAAVARRAAGRGSPARSGSTPGRRAASRTSSRAPPARCPERVSSRWAWACHSVRAIGPQGSAHENENQFQ